MRRAHVALSLAFLAACAGSPNRGVHAAGEARESAPPELAIPEAIPAAASGVVTAALPDTLRALWAMGLFTDLAADRAAALTEELEDYLEAQLGLEVGGVDTVFAFVIPRGDDDLAFAAGLSGVEGAPRGDRVGDHRGVDLVVREQADIILAAARGTLLMGDRGAVVVALDVLAGRADPLSTDTGLGSLLTRDVGHAHAAAALDIATIDDPELRAVGEQYGIHTAALALTGRGALAIARGDDEGLAAAADVIRAALDQVVASLGAEKARAKRSDPWAEAVGAIYAAHHAEAAIAALEPRVDDGKLILEASLRPTNPMIVSAMIGISAAIAVPAYMNYIERATIAEAVDPAVEAHLDRADEDGEPEVAIEALSPKWELRSIMRRAGPQVRQCYEKQLARDPEIGSGTITVHVQVGPGGALEAVETTENQLESEELSACIAAAAEKLPFDELENDDRIEINYPYRLEAEDD